MYSHTLKFGDALPFRTGCTVVVDAKFEGSLLKEDGVLIDILVAQTKLRMVMEEFDHKDLDTLFDANTNTTVEVIASEMFRRYRAHLGDSIGSEVDRLEIVVRESDVAYASYYEKLNGDD